MSVRMCGFFVFTCFVSYPENKAFTPNFCVPTKKVLFTFGIEIKIELNNISIMRGLHELLTARFYNISPTAAAGYRKILESNLNGHLPYLGSDKVIGRKVSAFNGSVIEDTRISTENGMQISRYNDNQDDPFINVLIIDGPMSRSGDACTYGSIDHRDMIISAANNANCVGHLIICNTPGGVAWTHNDYQQAIDYAHEQNQPVVMWIDGMCASAGMYVASMCDERWYMHPEDEVGCIGTMAMFYTMKDGQMNFNNETYHEIYDPESFDKNKQSRDIAENGDDRMLVKELAQLGKEFREACAKAFPRAKDEMLHGAIYKAGKVKGIFVNGQTDMGGAFARVIKLSKAMGNAAASNAHSSFNASGAVAKIVTVSEENNQSNTSNMNKKYQNVAAMLNVEQLAVKTDGKQEIENGSFLNIGQLDALENGIAALKGEFEKNAKTVEDAKAANEKALADTKANYEAQIAELKSANEKATADAKAASDKQVSELNAKMAEMQKDIDAKTSRIAELEQNLKDRDEQMKEMGQSAGKNIEAGNAPVDNGAGAKQVRIAAVQQVYDPSKPYAEQMFGNNK